MEKLTDQDLIDLIDNNISAERKTEILDQIDKNTDLKKRYQVLLSIHSGLEEITLNDPSKNFSDKVMSNLQNPQYVPDMISVPFRSRNLLTFLTIFAGILVGIYILGTGTISIPFFGQLTTEPINLKGVELNVNPIMNLITTSLVFKIFLGADMILAWFLLDKMVLKPYFANRRKKLAY